MPGSIIGARTATLGRAAAACTAAARRPRCGPALDVRALDVAPVEAAAAARGEAVAAQGAARGEAVDRAGAGRCISEPSGQGAAARRRGAECALAARARRAGDRAGPRRLQRPCARRPGRVSTCSISPCSCAATRSTARPPAPFLLTARRVGAGRAERQGGRRGRDRQHRRARRARRLQRRRARQRTRHAAPEGSAVAPARSLSRRRVRHRCAEGADQLRRRRALGGERRRRRARAARRCRRSTTSVPPTRRPIAARRRAPLAMLRDAASSRPLLNWKSLSLRGIELATAPGAPLAAGDRRDRAERLLRPRRARRERAAQPAGRHADAGEHGPGRNRGIPASVRAGSRRQPSARRRRRSCTSVRSRSSVAAINYNDRFVRPNYNANLSELSGRLASFSSAAAGSRASRLRSPS